MPAILAEALPPDCMTGTFNSHGGVALAVTVLGLLFAIYALTRGFHFLREEAHARRTAPGHHATKAWLLGIWSSSPTNVALLRARLSLPSLRQGRLLRLLHPRPDHRPHRLARHPRRPHVPLFRPGHLGRLTLFQLALIRQKQPKHRSRPFTAPHLQRALVSPHHLGAHP